jgi:Rieske 2Fe-2S family protein
MPRPSLDLPALLARRRPGYTLEAPFYTDPEIFEADLEHIFSRHWIYVGVEPDIPEPGDFMTVEIGRASLLLVRDEENAVRAFHNVCRHRGARLLSERKGMVGNLVCPYHQWTYDLEGRLLLANHMGEAFDRSCHGLKPVAVKSAGGLLFVCLAEDPPADFDEAARLIERYTAPFDLRQAKVVHETDLIEAGNWKLTMENNRECYHCNVNHPELTQSLFEYGFGFSPHDAGPELLEQARTFEKAEEEFTAIWQGCGWPLEGIEHLDDRPSGFRIQRLPIAGAGESQTLDTKVACRRLLGGLTQRKLGDLSIWTQPNSWHHFMSDHIVTFAVFPLAPERTLLRTKWLVHRDAVEGVDYDLEKLTEVWKATNEQDGALVARTQAGVSGTGYTPGPYSPYTEGLVEKFTNWYVNRLAAGLGLTR